MVQWSGGKRRTCEDLKERYYKVARSLQVAWEGTEEGAANLTLVKHPFNAQHERCAAVQPPALQLSAWLGTSLLCKGLQDTPL